MTTSRSSRVGPIKRTGRISLVTGGTDGIGRAVALALARGGDRVLFVGRDAARGAETLARLREIHPVDHVFVRADLSLLHETARAAGEVALRTDRLDAIVCCAGQLSTIPEWTSEDLERNFVLSYLSRYLLVRRLLPLVQSSASGRVVLVANAGVYKDTLDLDDLQYRRGKRGLDVAGRTQFANDLFAIELADRVLCTRIDVTCVAPGIVATNVLRNARGLSPIVRGIGWIVHRLFARSPDDAAHTPVFLAQHPDAAGSNGRFYGPARRERAVPDRVRRSDRRAALWDASDRLVRSFLDEQRARRVGDRAH